MKPFRIACLCCKGTLLSVLISFSAVAQPATDLSPDSHSSFVLPPQFFRFVLMSGITPKASLQNTEGTYLMKSSLQPGFDGGADYLHAISHTVYYSLGVRLVVTGRSSIFTTPALSSNPNAHYESLPALKDRQFDPTLAIPVLIEKVVPFSPRKSIYGNAGVQLTIPISSEYSSVGESLPDSAGRYVEVYDQTAQAYNSGKLWLSYKIGAGMQWVLKNQNVLSTGIVANLSFTHFVRGTYQVTLPDQPVTRGIFRATGSYIGLCAGYSLTGKYSKRIGGL